MGHPQGPQGPGMDQVMRKRNQGKRTRDKGLRTRESPNKAFSERVFVERASPKSFLSTIQTVSLSKVSQKAGQAARRSGTLSGGEAGVRAVGRAARRSGGRPNGRAGIESVALWCPPQGFFLAQLESSCSTWCPRGNRKPRRGQ